MSNFNFDSSKRVIKLGHFKFIMECWHQNKLFELNNFLDCNPDRTFIFNHCGVINGHKIDDVIVEQRNLINILFGLVHGTWNYQHNFYNGMTHVMSKVDISSIERQQTLIKLLELIEHNYHIELHNYAIRYDNPPVDLISLYAKISNFKDHYPNAHSFLYIYLKDIINCCLFRGCNLVLQFIVDKYSIYFKTNSILYNYLDKKVYDKFKLDYYNKDIDSSIKYCFDNKLIEIKCNDEYYTKIITKMFDNCKVFYNKLKLIADYKLCDVRNIDLVICKKYILNADEKYLEKVIQTAVECYMGQNILENERKLMEDNEVLKKSIIDKYRNLLFCSLSTGYGKLCILIRNYLSEYLNYRF